VVNYLKSRGVKDPLIARGYGETRLLVSPDTSSNKKSTQLLNPKENKTVALSYTGCNNFGLVYLIVMTASPSRTGSHQINDSKRPHPQTCQVFKT
jgi:hypothetical protein